MADHVGESIYWDCVKPTAKEGPKSPNCRNDTYQNSNTEVNMFTAKHNAMANRPRFRVFAAGALVLLWVMSLMPSVSLGDDNLLSPSADYSPQEVVRIVIEALGSNGDSEQDAGIATVFRFASPGNRANTGPLPRFGSMIKRGFSDMLDHLGSRYDEMEITGDIAVQAVWLLQPSGKEVGYAFQLGRQSEGTYSGMWMTDAVMPLGSRQGGTRI